MTNAPESFVKKYGGLDHFTVVVGSNLYGTNNPTSDTDYIIVLVDVFDISDHIQEPDADYHIYSYDVFTSRVRSMDVMCVEAYIYLMQKFNLNPFDQLVLCTAHNEDISEGLTLDKYKAIALDTLRRSFSQVCSNSWVKAKKKWLDGEEYIAIKSLFHSFRILELGIQIASKKEKIDFGAMNWLYFSILKETQSGRTLLEIMEEMKPLHLKMQTEFRKLAPKKIH